MATMSSGRVLLTRFRRRAASSTPRAGTTRSRSCEAASWSELVESGTIARSGARKSRSFTTTASHAGFQQLDEVHGTPSDADARLLECLDLLGCRSCRAGDDRTCVAHAAARRCSL